MLRNGSATSSSGGVNRRRTPALGVIVRNGWLRTRPDAISAWTHLVGVMDVDGRQSWTKPSLLVQLLASPCWKTLQPSEPNQVNVNQVDFDLVGCLARGRLFGH